MQFLYICPSISYFHENCFKLSGDEPKKKKLKAKKKKSTKKRIGSCQKEVEEGADGANAKSETETEEMEVNESGGIVEEENEESGDE